jgi:hypothetical protein
MLFFLNVPDTPLFLLLPISSGSFLDSFSTPFPSTEHSELSQGSVSLNYIYWDSFSVAVTDNLKEINTNEKVISAYGFNPWSAGSIASGPLRGRASRTPWRGACGRAEMLSSCHLGKREGQDVPLKAHPQ